MDRSLSEAAKRGDLEKLHSLIENDPFLLRAANLSDENNPLHLACIGGHVDFVRGIVSLCPELARELNRDGFTPLHIASASGAIEIVKELLSLNSNLCLVKGKEKRIPLHCAVVKGRVDVVKELISVFPDSVNDVTARGESCFHLAVKNNQFEAFKVLCLQNGCVPNVKDVQGNTVLHLAAYGKIYEVFDLLFDDNSGHKGTLEINPLNEKGMTPLDVLISEGGDPDIEQILKRADAITSRESNAIRRTLQNPSPNNNNNNNDQRRHRRSVCASKKLQEYFKYDVARDSPSKARDTLLVISVLIVTATYQAVLSPPGGVWQDDFTPSVGSNGTSHTAGQSVMGTRSPVNYGLFLLFNSLGFFMSLHMMNFLTLGLPLQFELRVALGAVIVTYDTCMVAITPDGVISVFFTVVSIVMPLMMPVLTMLARDFRKGGTRCEVSGGRVSV
ncbi:Ankyrin repeat family protein [Striga hermonthica]|uniref:Ankyrin repeat family protein n=1 Tax=Striga hermonthica TaxID=68872 RepID=A0A9N7RSS5_STRHE|nr:Ankyrin repeat family protein [Striga hermonthica]